MWRKLARRATFRLPEPTIVTRTQVHRTWLLIVGVASVGACDWRPHEGAARPAPFEVREAYALTPDGVRLWYRVAGTGHETIVVGAANYMQSAFDALVTPSRRVVTYDIRGRGRSDSVTAAQTGIVEFDAADIDVIRQAVGADTVAVIGWSGVALGVFQYAWRYPEHVSRFVLLTPVGPRWVPWWDDMRTSAAAKVDTAAQRALTARVEAGEFARDEAGLCRLSARLGLRTNWPDSTQWHLAPDVCDSPNELPGRYGVFVPRLLAKLGKYDWRADIPRVRAPWLVIHGELDNPPLAGSREWVAGAPNGRLLVLRGAGHWPHYEQPERTMQLLREFFDGRWPSESEFIAANR
jgi:proline iminopeptidase